jgi:hypothetical protein
VAGQWPTDLRIWYVLVYGGPAAVERIDVSVIDASKRHWLDRDRTTIVWRA